VQFGVSENQLFFEAGDRRLLARMIDVNFPNYMEVIARDNDRHVMVDRERLLSTIRRISLVANERTRAVRFDFAPGKLTVSSTNPELGDARETVPIDYSGNPFFVGLNAAYVTDVNATRGALRAIELPAAVQPTVVYEAAVVRDGDHGRQARAFIDGLLHGRGAAQLRAAGFGPPPA